MSLWPHSMTGCDAESCWWFASQRSKICPFTFSPNLPLWISNFPQKQFQGVSETQPSHKKLFSGNMHNKKVEISLKGLLETNIDQWTQNFDFFDRMQWFGPKVSFWANLNSISSKSPLGNFSESSEILSENDFGIWAPLSWTWQSWGMMIWRCFLVRCDGAKVVSQNLKQFWKSNTCSSIYTYIIGIPV